MGMAAARPPFRAIGYADRLQLQEVLSTETKFKADWFHLRNKLVGQFVIRYFEWTERSYATCCIDINTIGRSPLDLIAYM